MSVFRVRKCLRFVAGARVARSGRGLTASRSTCRAHRRRVTTVARASPPAPCRTCASAFKVSTCTSCRSNSGMLAVRGGVARLRNQQKYTPSPSSHSLSRRAPAVCVCLYTCSITLCYVSKVCCCLTNYIIVPVFMHSQCALFLRSVVLC